MDKIFDEKLEKGVRDRFDKGFKDAKDTLDEGKKMMMQHEEQVAERIKTRPVEWVAGAFIAGLLIGKLLSRKD